MFRILSTRWWLLRPFTRRNSAMPSRRSPSRHRLAVESLEHRLAPAVDFASLSVNPNSYDHEHILVQVRSDIVNPNAMGVPSGVTFETAVGLVPGLWEVQLNKGTTVQNALASFEGKPWVVGVSPNFILSITQTPNDTQFGDLWGLNNTGQTGGTADADIDAPEAWDITQGSPNVIVAVIDTGVDYTHPDLAANIWTNDEEANGLPGVDDDGDGFVDDIHGYDFANDDGDPMDDHEHGTHVAGTIAAVGDNHRGVIGVAPNVRIMALKFLDASGNGTTADAIRALNYAVEMGATISNNSYGGSSAEDSDPLFLEAIQNAAAFGHIFVAGAGNSGLNNGQTPFYPASFDSDNIISVAATDDNDQLASFSNYGADVDLAAPGVDILSTVPGGTYASLSGTSMATPHVTGVIALVRSLHPEWTYQQVIDRVLGSVDYLPNLDGRVGTSGRLNAARALLDTDGPHVVLTDPSGGTSGIITTMRVSFNEPIDPTTFGVNDIESFTGPDGPITVTGVSAVAGSFNRKFDISFTSQAVKGDYALVFGPAVADATGNLMDQDADGIKGEATQDQYTATFSIGDQHIFNATDTPKAFSILSGVVSSSLVVPEDLGIADLNVKVNVNSGDVGFLSLNLVAPNGTRVALAPLSATEMGPEYRNTVFDDEAAVAITDGTSPFEGSYRPLGNLSDLDNLSAVGTWRLEVTSVFDGTINSWSLQIIANPPKMRVTDVSLAEGDGGTTQATFTVSLAHVVDVPVTVDYATADGTATAGTDYDAVAGSLLFAPGELTKTVTVNVYGDAVDEGDENFFLNLSNAVNATLFDSQGVATIVNDELGVAIGDVSTLEGNSGNTNTAFTISLSQASTYPVTVQYSTAPATATAGTDYVTTSSSVTFNPGETSKTVTIPVKGDTTNELTETFLVNLTASGAYVTDAQAVGTILNDDPVPVMSVKDVSITEGNSGTKILNFTVILANATNQTVTANYATADGSATAGSDYTSTSGTITLTPGQTSKNVSVIITGDTTPEPSETFALNLGGAVNAILMDSQAVGTILTDDVSLSVNDITVTEGDVGSFDAIFTVTLSGALSADVRVNYATANGSATSGADYVAGSGILTIPAGQTSTTVTIHGISDIFDELDETLLVNLSSAVNAIIADTQGQATILDDDAPPTVSVSGITVTEGDSGTKNLTYTVKLSQASKKSITVGYATADGTATAGSDYTAKVGTLTIGAGATSATVTVTANGDIAGEIDETVLLNLTAATNATISDPQGVGTIQDDDSLVVDDVAVVEGNSGASVATFTVSLLAPRSVPVTVNYATANGTAGGGTDYLVASGSLTFAPGETSKTVSVIVASDQWNEANETFYLNLSNAVGTLIADSQGIATIVNDDAPPTVSINDVAITEANSATKNLTFTVALSQPSIQIVSIQYATADGSATAGSDYVSKVGTLNIAAGSSTGTITVTVNGDTAVEGNETFLVNLTGVTNAVIADNQGVGTIQDDDPQPALAVTDVTTTEGNSGTKTYGFNVTLSAAATQTVTVQATTFSGTATAGSDFVSTSVPVTFTAGQTTKPVTVTVNGDTAPEANETFFLRLSSPTNAIIADNEGVGTIQNDDSSLRVDDITLTEGNSGTTNAVFTVTLTGAISTDPVTVNYTLATGTASSGSDFVSGSGTVTFAPGQTTQTVSVPVLGDTINEVNETFLLNLAGAVNATIADAQGVATIIDDPDPQPSVSVDDPVILEGDTGTKNITYTVRLSAPSGKTVSINYATADGTATAGSDYTAKVGTLTIGAGATSATVTVTANGDIAGEIDETVLLNLTAATNATISDPQGVGTIQDDDSLVVDDVAVVEGNSGASVATFTVSLLAPRSVPVTVNYATANGTAGGGTDYLVATGSLTFAPGETSKTVSVTVMGDVLDEQDQTFYLNLSNAVGTPIADSQGIATIADDDALPSISMTSSVVTAEGNTGTKSVVFTFTLSQPSGQAVSFTYGTLDGTATAGTDYVAKNGTLTFAAGSTVQTLTVLVNGDLLNEGNETFSLVISNPINATIAPGFGQGLATLVDDEVL